MSKNQLSEHIETLIPFDVSLYSDMDLAGLSAFAIHWLQERHIPTTFENIVVTAFKMFPAKFALEGWEQYPDAARINRSLLQLLPKYRNWARGSVQKGYLLTESGVEKVSNIREALETGKSTVRNSTRQRQPLPRTRDLSSELETLERSTLYTKWKEGTLDQGTSLELLDMLGAYAYTPSRALRERITLLHNAASQLGREDIVEFLKSVRRSFDQQFRDS